MADIIPQEPEYVKVSEKVDEKLLDTEDFITARFLLYCIILSSVLTLMSLYNVYQWIRYLFTDWSTVDNILRGNKRVIEKFLKKSE